MGRARSRVTDRNLAARVDDLADELTTRLDALRGLVDILLAMVDLDDETAAEVDRLLKLSRRAGATPPSPAPQPALVVVEAALDVAEFGETPSRVAGALA
jgi:hypothetical protein